MRLVSGQRVKPSADAVAKNIVPADRRGVIAPRRGHVGPDQIRVRLDGCRFSTLYHEQWWEPE